MAAVVGNILSRQHELEASCQAWYWATTLLVGNTSHCKQRLLEKIWCLGNTYIAGAHKQRLLSDLKGLQNENVHLDNCKLPIQYHNNN